jgi:hypothetical protein
VLKGQDAIQEEQEQGNVHGKGKGKEKKEDGPAACLSSNAMTFAKRLYDENVHRVTESMTERRVTGWKLVCKTLLTRLENVLAGDVEEFDEDYQSAASVGSVLQVSVATELSKVKIVEALKEEAAKKKLFSLDDIRAMYSSKRSLGGEEEEKAPLLAKDDPDVTDDDLFLCSLRRDSNGEIVGTRGQFVSEDMIRLQLQSAQSERASTTAGGSLARSISLASGQAPRGDGVFPELFAQGGEGGDDVSVITHDTAGLEGEGEGLNALDGLVADAFFPHIPALEQCQPWEPLCAKLCSPVVLKMYAQDLPSRIEEEAAPPPPLAAEEAKPKSRYLIKQASFAFGADQKKEEKPTNGLGMKFEEISILGKKSFWLESRREMLRQQVSSDEEKQRQEEQFKIERWKTFISDSVAAGGVVFGRDARIAKPMKILHNSDGSQLTREERKVRLAQMLKENREMYVL